MSIARQSEMDMAAAKERMLQTMRKNLKLVAVALLVLAIEKMTEMLASLFNPVTEIKDNNCVC